MQTEGRARRAGGHDARRGERAALLRRGAGALHDQQDRQPRQADQRRAAHPRHRADQAGASRSSALIAGLSLVVGAAARRRHGVPARDARPPRALARRPRIAPGRAVARPAFALAADGRPAASRARARRPRPSPSLVTRTEHASSNRLKTFCRIDGAGAHAAGNGRHIGAILMDEGKLTAVRRRAGAGAPARARLALRRGGDRAEPDHRRRPAPGARQAVRVPLPRVAAPTA